MIKFFNENRGYGFVMVKGHDRDIFIHSRTLESNRINALDSAQKVLVRTAEDEKGPTISTIRFYSGEEGVEDLELDQPDIGNEAIADEAVTFENDSHGEKKKFYDLTNDGS